MKTYPWQARQRQQLLDVIEKKRIPHALLLAGRHGLGMDQFAASLAAYLLCSGDKDGAACGECRSCALFQSGNHPDFFPVGPEEEGKQIKVETIRGMIGFVHLHSQYARYKIALISPAESMNRSAANSLLKTLEEPPANSVIILVSNQAASLPVTIRSRCQRLNFSAAYDEPTVEWLAGETGSDAEQAAGLLTMAHGRPLYAREMMENDALAARQRVLADLARLTRPSANVMKIAREWHNYGAAEVFQWLMSLLSVMVRLKLPGLRTPAAPPALKRDLQQVTNELNLQGLIGCYDQALQHYRALTGPYNLNQMSLLEEFIVSWQSLSRENGGYSERSRGT